MMVGFLYLDPNNTDFLKNILPDTDDWFNDATDVEYLYDTAYRRMCYRMAFWVSVLSQYWIVFFLYPITRL